MASMILIGPAHPYRGGLASFNERLAREFLHQGWEPLIFTFSLQYPDFLFPGTSQYSTEPSPADLRISRKINSINPFNWIQVGLELRKMAPDLIIIRYWLPLMAPSFGTILSLAKKNRQTKIICIADNVIPHEKRIGDHWFTKYFISKPDAFILMSEKVRQDLLLYRPDAKCEIIDHPLYDNFGEKVDVLQARNLLKIDPKEKIVLFFGFIRKYKGLDLLLAAMAKVKSASKNIKLLVAGEFYEDSKMYEELLDQLNIRDVVYWHTHFITDSDVKYYLSASDVVVQPYRNATQSGVTPLAFHFEIPMIVTNVGSLARLVPHEKVGLVCEPTVESISKAILQFFDMETHLLKENLKLEKRKLSWTHLFDKIMLLLKAI